MRYLVAIPIFNEQAYLTGVLARVRRHADEILVVDDGSTDATPRLLAAERDIHVIRHPVNRGYGQSLISAFCFAQRRCYDWLITMDCDEQHEPAHIPDFLAAAAEDDADIISGTRYLTSFADNNSPPPDRRRINAVITRRLNDELGLGITDAFCGFKAYRVAAVRLLRLTEPGYAVPLQFWVQAVRAGLRIRELPVRLIYNDPNRHFGGVLDDPDARLAHYLEVYKTELAAPAPPAAAEPQPAACTSRRC
jgi:glycosyltransferase involved in cell wall biosynthesis